MIIIKTHNKKVYLVPCLERSHNSEAGRIRPSTPIYFYFDTSDYATLTTTIATVVISFSINLSCFSIATTITGNSN